MKVKAIQALLFSPVIAEELGKIDEAVFLHYICFWVQVNKEKVSKKHLKAGKYWTYGSDTFFAREVFPWLTPAKIKRIRKNLVRADYIETGCFNSFGPDKTTWYTFTDKVYEVVGLKYIDKILKKKNQPSYLLR